jgi:hypothetical protein
MFVRRRPLLRAAAVGGGAYMAGKARQRPQMDRQETRASQGTAQEAPATAADQPAGGSVPDQLAQLSALHEQGALSDAEFAAAKSKLLGQ